MSYGAKDICGLPSSVVTQLALPFICISEAWSVRSPMVRVPLGQHVEPECLWDYSSVSLVSLAGLQATLLILGFGHIKSDSPVQMPSHLASGQTRHRQPQILKSGVEEGCDFPKSVEGKLHKSRKKITCLDNYTFHLIVDEKTSKHG